MEINTKKIIELLPFDNEFRTHLLHEFEGLGVDQKSELVDILWDAYDAYFLLALQNNIQMSLEKAKKGEVQLDTLFYQRVCERTEKELSESASQNNATDSLRNVRTKLESILAEKNHT